MLSAPLLAVARVCRLSLISLLTASAMGWTTWSCLPKPAPLDEACRCFYVAPCTHVGWLWQVIIDPQIKDMIHWDPWSFHFIQAPQRSPLVHSSSLKFTPSLPAPISAAAPCGQSHTRSLSSSQVRLHKCTRKSLVLQSSFCTLHLIGCAPLPPCPHSKPSRRHLALTGRGVLLLFPWPYHIQLLLA